MGWGLNGVGAFVSGNIWKIYHAIISILRGIVRNLIYLIRLKADFHQRF
jgi:hypothetical protein